MYRVYKVVIIGSFLLTSCELVADFLILRNAIICQRISLIRVFHNLVEFHKNSTLHRTPPYFRKDLLGALVLNVIYLVLLQTSADNSFA